MSFTTIRVTVGRVILVAGVLVLLFIPYLLWGTGLITAQNQTTLRNEFSAAQRQTGTVLPRVRLRPNRGTTGPLTAPAIAPPAQGGAVGQLNIPKIGLSMMVVEGTGQSDLEAGPGHYSGTPLPGEPGNAAIAGHRTTYLHPFYNLDQLAAGDSINVVTLQGLFLYQVTRQLVVSPNDVAVVGPTRTPQLTLTTCNPRYSASQRLVVQATLVASVLADPKHPLAPVTTQTQQPRRVRGNPSRHKVTSAAPAVVDQSRDWTAAIGWGAIVAALTTAIWFGASRARRGRRAAVIGFGVATWLVVVFFFFQSVAPLLPASY